MKDISRRALLAGGVTFGAFSICAPVAAALGQSFFTPSSPTLGLQIYTLGTEAFADLDATFAAVAKIGYRAVELLFFCGHKPRELRAALHRAGLKAHSAQIAYHDYGVGYDLTTHIDATIAGAKEVGLDTLVSPVFPFPSRFAMPKDPAQMGSFVQQSAAAMTGDDWKASAETMNKTGALLKQHGLRLGHHNHNVDFTPINGMTGYDILVRSTDPALVTLELDIGWAAAAGHDPIAVLNQYPNRFSMMHVKDIKATTKVNFALQQDPAVVGQGTLDFAKILRAARMAGVQSFYVEQEPPFTIPRIEAARQSYDYLTQLRV